MVTELLRGRKARIGDGDHGEALQGGGGAIKGGVLGQGGGAREDGAHPAPAVDYVREDPRQRSRPTSTTRVASPELRRAKSENEMQQQQHQRQ